jgi:hypothetical protein
LFYLEATEILLFLATVVGAGVGVGFVVVVVAVLQDYNVNGKPTSKEMPTLAKVLARIRPQSAEPSRSCPGRGPSCGATKSPGASSASVSDTHFVAAFLSDNPI